MPPIMSVMRTATQHPLRDQSGTASSLSASWADAGARGLGWHSVGHMSRSISIEDLETNCIINALIRQYNALMEHGPAALASAIGTRVKLERQKRGWTLDQLATAAQVSRRAVVNVEQGSANPSVGTLLRLSDALGVGLPALVEPPETEPLRVTRRGEGAQLWTGQEGGNGVLVAGTRPPDVLELWDWTLRPSDRHRSEAHAPGTKELIQVLDGTITVEVGDQTVTLGPGDALTFHGDVTHGYANTTEQAARFTLAVFEPGVGSSIPKTHSEVLGA